MISQDRTTYKWNQIPHLILLSENGKWQFLAWEASLQANNPNDKLIESLEVSLLGDGLKEGNWATELVSLTSLHKPVFKHPHLLSVIRPPDLEVLRFWLNFLIVKQRAAETLTSRLLFAESPELPERPGSKDECRNTTLKRAGLCFLKQGYIQPKLQLYPNV